MSAFPWTPEQLQTLKRMRAEGKSSTVIGRVLGCSRSVVIGKIQRLKRGVPQRRPTQFDTNVAADLYGQGWGIARIATAMGCSKSKVGDRLRAAGVRLRSKGRPSGSGLSPLAREIFDDLSGPPGGSATISILRDWLGESTANLEAALDQLCAHGYVTATRLGYAIVDRQAERAA